MRFATAARPWLLGLLAVTGAAQTTGRHLPAKAGEEVSDGLIVRLREGARFGSAKLPAARWATASNWRAMNATGLYRVQVDPADLFAVGEALASDPAVEYVEPDRIRRVSLVLPNDSRYSEQWNLPAIRAFQAWQWFPGRYTTASLNLQRALVAVLDTGADCTHPDFANEGNSSTDSALGGQLKWAASAALMQTTLPLPACLWADDHGHGTLVSGVAGAATHNAQGVASLGAMVELMIVKVADSNGASNDSTLADGIRLAASAGARVISISLTGPGYSQTLQDAVDFAWARNVVLIGAVGNAGTTAHAYPASSNHVIGVGAFDTNGAVAGFSNRGTPVDVAAPGVSILSTAPIASGLRYGGVYAAISGTSLAAPHVAALAGMLAMASPGISADEIVRRIERSADSSVAGWEENLGYGRIDAERAITGANWRAVSTGGVSGQIQNAAGLALAGATVTLNAEALTTDEGGLFRFTAVAPGNYFLTVAATGETSLQVPVTISGGNDTPVQVRVGTAYGTLRGNVTAGGVAAAGMVVAAWLNGTQRAVAVTDTAGQYRLFVPLGTYEIRAGGMFTTTAAANATLAAGGGTVDVALLALQNFGRLQGTIRNAANGAVNGAQVVVSQAGRSFGGVSSGTGEYRTVPGPAGTYLAEGEDQVSGASSPAAVAIINDTTSRLDLVLRTRSQTTTLTPESAFFNAVGGAGSATIAAGSSSLAWTAASSDSSWLTLTSAASGTGSTALSYNVRPNASSATRIARIQVNEAVLTVTQTGATAAVIADPTSMAISEGGDSRAVSISSSGAWVAVTQTAWLSVQPPGAGSGNGSFLIVAQFNSINLARIGTVTVNGTVITVSQPPSSVFLDPATQNIGPEASTRSFSVGVSSPNLPWSATPLNSWITVNPPGFGQGNGSVSYTVTANPNLTARTGSIAVSGAVFSVTQAGAVPTGGGAIGTGLHFVPVQPCRLVDTREDLGEFGRPALVAAVARNFTLPSSACGIPSSAKAYALNVTVVPRGPLGYLTIFPAGQTQPLVSTLNAVDGRVKANAAIVPAGTGGAIRVYATDDTDLILDINGYFIEPGGSADALAFYPVTPCRVADTRNATGALGGPVLAAGTARSFAVLSSTCGIPSTARAYSLNATVVPSGGLGYMTLFPTGRAQPFVSTLNAAAGGVVANAAIVPAGDNGAVSAYVTGTSHLVLDINGYFAPPGASGAQRFFAVTPCRVLDTRNANGSLGGPVLTAGQVRAWPLPSSACGLPGSAAAYSLNATVVPPSGLGFLTMWPAGQTQPLASTLNAVGDPIVANAAIVRAGTSGAVSTYVSNQTHLIVDTNGYFAP